MKLAPDVTAGLAEHLEQARLQGHDVVKITDAHPAMDWEDAYAIQDAIRARKLGRGDRLVGRKAGLTSHAKMKQVGVDSPVFGFLAESFAVADGGTVRHAELIHPTVEPEIAFVLGRALRGPGCHIGAVLAATDFVLPAIEGIDLRTLRVVMEVNGRIRAIGAGAAVLGHPAASVAMRANFLADRGEAIPAGTVILTGGVTEAVAVAPGDHVPLRVQGLGACSLHFE